MRNTRSSTSILHTRSGGTHNLSALLQLCAEALKDEHPCIHFVVISLLFFITSCDGSRGMTAKRPTRLKMDFQAKISFFKPFCVTINSPPSKVLGKVTTSEANMPGSFSVSLWGTKKPPGSYNKSFYSCASTLAWLPKPNSVATFLTSRSAALQLNLRGTYLICLILLICLIW